MLHPFFIVKRFEVAFEANIKIIKIFLKKKNANIFLEYHPYDFSIGLQKRAQILFRSIYSLSQNELVTFKQYIDKNIAKFFICHSKSLA